MLFLIFAVLSTMLAPSVRADDVDVYVSLDKVQYEPGGQGTISITVRNRGDDPIEIRNVSIQFEDWMLFTEEGWDKLGKKTIVYEDEIPVGSNKTISLEDISFSVPTDGRAESTDVAIQIYTNEPSALHAYESVSVIKPYDLSRLRALNNIVVLLSVTAILAIISAVIIAAAVFLSARRPGVTWQREE